VFIPTLLAEIGVGAMYPVLAISAVRMGASVALASAIVTAYTLGRLAGSALGGGVIARRGAVRTGVVGLVGMSAAAAGCGLSTHLGIFTVAVTAFGIAHSVFHLARQTVLGDLIHAAARARGLTTLAGMWRIGNFIGPVLGAVLIGAWGLRSAYVIGVAGTLAAAVWLYATGHWQAGKHHVRTEHASNLTVARQNARLIGTLGVGLALTTAIRSARIVVLPLWAESLGMSEGTVSAVFAASMAVDMLLFYPAGVASDRWGRRWQGVPSTAMLAVGFILLPFTGNVAGITVAAILMGIGNGWGSGLLMTLGADLAPHRSRSVFLGLWMMLGDAGALAGPALVSLGAIASLAAGVFGVAAVGVVSTVMLRVWIPPGRAHEAAIREAER